MIIIRKETRPLKIKTVNFRKDRFHIRPFAFGGEKGIQYARNHHLLTEFCPKAAASAAEIPEEILSARKEV